MLLASTLAAAGGSSAGAVVTEGTITGIVRGPGGAPLAGVYVSAEAMVSPWDWGEAVTGPDGRYSIPGLLAGSYRVGFNPYDVPGDLLEEHYLDAHRYQDATPVVVTAGGIRSGIDALLEEAGSLEGTVTGPGGLPLAGVRVQVEPVGTTGCCDTGSDTTSWDGTWSIDGLAADSYVAHFQPIDGSALAPEFYDDATDDVTATPIVLAPAADVIGIDAQLDVGATISGTVTGPTGNPLAGVSVSASTEAEYFEEFSATTDSLRLYLEARRAVTDHLGQYTIVGVAPADHLVHFSPYGNELVDEWWDDATDPADAAPVVVAQAATITGIDAQLGTRGAISGTVTGVGSGPLANVLVVLYRPDGQWVSGEYTAPDGTYDFPTLDPGDHVVSFSAGPSSGWRAEFFDDAATRPDAELVTIASGQSVTGVDAELQLCGAPALFSDVPLYQQFCTAIEWLTTSGVGGGFVDGTFRPTAPLTRQAVAAFLHRLAGDDPGPFPDPGFSDVPTSSPFYADIAWLVDSGLGGGFADGTFRPGAPVSRQALASFLYQLAGAPDVTVPYSPYDDVPPTHPFIDAIYHLSRRGVINGYLDDTFRPTVTVSRQALASFLYSYVNAGMPTTVP